MKDAWKMARPPNSDEWPREVTMNHIIANLKEAIEEIKRDFTLTASMHIEYCIDILEDIKDE